MNNLYNRIFSSIGKEIQYIINEQFNISDLDFNDSDEENTNIFNKELVSPRRVYNNILHGIDISEYEIHILNNYVAEVKSTDRKELKSIIEYYS